MSNLPKISLRLSRNIFWKWGENRPRMMWLLYFSVSYQWILHNKILLCKEKYIYKKRRKKKKLKQTCNNPENPQWIILSKLGYFTGKSDAKLTKAQSVLYLLPSRGSFSLCRLSPAGNHEGSTLLHTSPPSVLVHRKCKNCQHQKLTLFRVRVGDLTSFFHITFQNKDSHIRTCRRFHRQWMKQ